MQPQLQRIEVSWWKFEGRHYRAQAASSCSSHVLATDTRAVDELVSLDIRRERLIHLRPQVSTGLVSTRLRGMLDERSSQAADLDGSVGN